MMIQDKKDEMEKLVYFTTRKFRQNQLTANELSDLLKEAFRLGHYVGHVQGENFNSRLIEEYKTELLILDERLRRYGE